MPLRFLLIYILDAKSVNPPKLPVSNDNLFCSHQTHILFSNQSTQKAKHPIQSKLPTKPTKQPIFQQKKKTTTKQPTPTILTTQTGGLSNLGLVRGIFESIFALPSGFLADRLPRPALIFMGSVLWGAGLVGCAFSPEPGVWMVFGCFWVNLGPKMRWKKKMKRDGLKTPRFLVTWKTLGGEMKWVTDETGERLTTHIFWRKELSRLPGCLKAWRFCSTDFWEAKDQEVKAMGCGIVWIDELVAALCFFTLGDLFGALFIQNWSLQGKTMGFRDCWGPMKKGVEHPWNTWN